MPGKIARNHGAIGSDPGERNICAIFLSVDDGWVAMKEILTGVYGDKGMDCTVDHYANTSSEKDRMRYKRIVHAGAGVNSDTKVNSLSPSQLVLLMNVMASQAEGWKGSKYVE